MTVGQTSGVRRTTQLKGVAIVAPAVVLFVLAGSSLAAGQGEGAPGTRMNYRMMMLVIQLGVILFAAKLGNIFFEKMRLPGTLGEIAAGVLIGPYALGQFGFHGLPNGLFPASQADVLAISPELYGMASLAAVILLFNIGLKTNLKLLMRFALVGGLVGLGGMLASFFLGAASVQVLGAVVLGQHLDFMSPQPLVLGTITAATSVTITSRILSRKRKMDSPEGVTILSAAVIDDVMGIILLAVVMGILTASQPSGNIDWRHIAAVAGKAVGVWLGASVIGLVATRKISFLLKWFGERTSIAAMALGLALVLAGLFEQAGLAMIIGAYVMGLSLSRADIAHVIRERLRPVGAVLVPIFFCVMGMQINPGVLTLWPVIVFGLAYGVVAMVAKLIGCGVPALLTNFNLRGAARIGFGMTPRCEVALVIAGVSLSANLIHGDMLAAVIIMIAINTVIAPIALAGLYRGDKPGTRHPVEGDRDEQTLAFEFPSAEMTGFFVEKLTAVFESEGFFVHLISRIEHLYQLRKDRMVIEFHHTGSDLVFSCRKDAVPLVNGAVYEALADLERAINVLKAPLDRKSITDGLLQQQDAGPAGPQTLKVAEYLTVELIKPRLEGETKEEIIDELIGLLADNGLISNTQAARQAVWDRENSMSTGLQYGVAIPHGKTDMVDRLVCAVGLKPEGVDFDAMDGQPSTIFVLTLSPKNKPAPHVQFMSAISTMLNSTGRRKILACRERRQIYQLMTSTPVAAEARPANRQGPGTGGS